MVHGPLQQTSEYGAVLFDKLTGRDRGNVRSRPRQCPVEAEAVVSENPINFATVKCLSVNTVSNSENRRNNEIIFWLDELNWNKKKELAYYPP